VNRWGGNVNPISLIGNNSWTDVTASVAVLVRKSRGNRLNQEIVGGVAASSGPEASFVNWQNTHNRECLDAQGLGVSRSVGSRINTRSCASAKAGAFT
jgi:hypothetical protein